MKRPGLMVAIGVPKGGPGGAAGGGNCVTVPADSLAMPDEQNGDQLVTPEKGDKVTLTIEGTVSSLEGGNACVQVEACNGKPVEGAGADQEPDEDDGQGAGGQPMGSPEDQAEGDSLREEAGQRGGI